MVDAFGSACFEVQRYPGDEVAFDDFYERAAPDEGATLYLCKSTGEAFRPDERAARAPRSAAGDRESLQQLLPEGNRSQLSWREKRRRWLS